MTNLIQILAWRYEESSDTITFREINPKKSFLQLLEQYERELCLVGLR